MKAILLAGVAAVVIGFAPAVNAQTVGVGVGPVGVGIDFSPEQRTVVREYVKRERPVTFRETVAVGSTLPEEVEVRAVPSDWGPAAGKYRYVYSGEKVYLVEPGSRRVVQIID